MKKKKEKDFIKMGVKNLIGIPLIGASASMVNTLPKGTAKNIVGVVPGLQATSLAVKNLEFLDLKPKKMKGGKK